jgi:ERCC4-related helicase
MNSLDLDEAMFLHSHLTDIIGQEACPPCNQVPDSDISPKVMTLLKYLVQEYKEDMLGVVFVKERSTAAILALLISSHSLTQQHFRAEPFVGESNLARRQTVADLADTKAQRAALLDFRSGKINLLVCTSVLEEGVDVSSMNLVIRFDDPANFRAFIQSRGRARMFESKFVLMCVEDDPEAKYERWRGLEAEMKAKYMDDQRQIALQVENEDIDEEYDEFLSSDVTG